MHEVSRLTQGSKDWKCQRLTSNQASATILTGLYRTVISLLWNPYFIHLIAADNYDSGAEGRQHWSKQYNLKARWQGMWPIFARDPWMNMKGHLWGEVAMSQLIGTTLQRVVYASTVQNGLFLFLPLSGKTGSHGVWADSISFRIMDDPYSIRKIFNGNNVAGFQCLQVIDFGSHYSIPIWSTDTEKKIQPKNRTLTKIVPE